MNKKIAKKFGVRNFYTKNLLVIKSYLTNTLYIFLVQKTINCKFKLLKEVVCNKNITQKEAYKKIALQI